MITYTHKFQWLHTSHFDSLIGLVIESFYFHGIMKFTKKSETSKLHKSSFSPNSLAVFPQFLLHPPPIPVISIFTLCSHFLSSFIQFYIFPMAIIIHIYLYPILNSRLIYSTTSALSVLTGYLIGILVMKVWTKHSIFSKTCSFFYYSNLTN